jgi:hypothetical protein
MHELLFENQEALELVDLHAYALELGAGRRAVRR